MHFRPARVEEADELTELAVRATRSGGYDDEALARMRPGLQANLDLISAGVLFVAEEESGRLVGWVALRPLQFPGVVLLEDVFIEPELQQRGAGKQLFQFAVERARRFPARVVLVFANPFADGFYDGLGFMRLGKVPYAYLPGTELTMFAYTVPEPTVG